MSSKNLTKNNFHQNNLQPFQLYFCSTDSIFYFEYIYKWKINPMENLKLLLLGTFLAFHCTSPSYQLHINQSFYPPSQQMRMSGGSLIANARPDSVMEFTGVYCDQHVFIDKYPVIRLYHEGRYYIPLSEKLQCPDGMLVKIKGKIIQLSVTYALIKKTLSYNHLEPVAFEVILDTQPLIKSVNDEYHRIRQKLQEQITIEQSKLQLTENPEWAIWYDGERKIFIFHSHQYDLMYVADIEFIVDAQKKKIKDVYAREWFKGE